MFTKILWFISESLLLDYWYIRVSRETLVVKVIFISKKYYELFLLLSSIKSFELGISNLKFKEKLIYYDTKYGIAGYQSMISRHGRMLKQAGIKDLKLVVDVGANVGFFSLMIADFFSNAKVYSIEPVTQAFACLKKNLIGGKFNIFNIAISNINGFTDIIYNNNNTALSRVKRAGESIPSGYKSLKAESITLDAFCENNNIKNIDLLKIDTEGFELEVLLGARKILEYTKYLSIEITTTENSSYTFSQLNSLLYSNHYNFQLVSFRNFTGRGFGAIPVGDFLYKNMLLSY